VHADFRDAEFFSRRVATLNNDVAVLLSGQSAFNGDDGIDINYHVCRSTESVRVNVD